MAQYWETRPRPSATPAAEKDGNKSSDGPPNLLKNGKLHKDFHRHRERLAKQDGTREAEDCRSELCHYLKVVAKDVLPKTDVVQWWQVCIH